MLDRPLKLTLLEMARVTDPPFAMAPVAERLGFSRYWITEHFEAKPGGLGSSLVSASVAATRTSAIRIGTAGILIRYYPTALAAIQFRSLAALFPGRIDAGLAGGWALHKDALERDLVDWDFDAKVQLAVDEVRADRWPPLGGTPPELWYLGASARSAKMTGNVGIGYGYALQFTTNVDNPDAIRQYRKTFVPSERQESPRAIVAVAGMCSDSVTEAERSVAHSLEHWAGGIDPTIVGTPQTCRDRLYDLARRYDVEEIAFINLARDPDVAGRSLELLSEALELRRP